MLLAASSERVGQRLGVGHGVGQVEFRVCVFVETERQDEQASLLCGAYRRRRPGHRSARRYGGDQIGAVIGDHFYDITAFIERKAAAQAQRLACGRGRPVDADGDFVDAPFHAPDAAVARGDFDFGIDLRRGGAAAVCRRKKTHRGRAAAGEHLVEVELRRRLAHEPARIAREFFAHQIGAVERLIDLVDADGFEPAHHVQQRRPVGGGRKEALRDDRDPLT